MKEAELFFEKHRSYNRQLASLPNKNMSDDEIALWILQGGHGDWLQLDLNIDTLDFLFDEKYAENSYVPHRDEKTGEGTHAGWSSCTLHGIDVDKTNHWTTYNYKEEPEYQWTYLGKKTVKIKEFCKALPFESLARVRFMKLGPMGYISPHNDQGSGIDWDKIWNHPLPINIAIDHPPGCFMTIENSGVVPFNRGCAFLVNILKNHSVINFSSDDRKHIIVHGIVGNRKKEYCKLLADSYRKAYALQREKLKI
jgi:hypothetical protein